MNWNKESWTTTIVNCPHCNEKINITSKSIISTKAMIIQLLNKYNSHSCNKLGRKKIQLSVVIKSSSRTSEMLKTEWDHNNSIII